MINCAKVERVVLNALADRCGSAADFLMRAIFFEHNLVLSAIDLHRLQGKPIQLWHTCS